MRLSRFSPVMTPRRLAASLAVALLAPSPARAEEPLGLSQFVHDKWTQRDGLPHNVVEKVVAARSGYLWFGTQEGLVRFDGVRFRVFDRLGTPGLAGDEIYALEEDASGDLWIGTSSGLSRLHGEAFETVRTDSGPPVTIHALESDGNDLWAGTPNGLRRLHGGAWSSIGTQEGLVDERISALAQARGGGVWFGTRRGLARWAEGRVEPVDGRGLPSEIVTAILEDGEGVLWVGTDRGLARRRSGGAAFEPVSGVGDRQVASLLSDRSGALWVSSSTGILRLAAGGTEILSDRTFIANGLAEDGEGSIWFGTATDGLHRLRRGRVVTFSREEGLSSEVVWAVAGGAGGAVWIAGDGGLDRIVAGRPAPIQRELTGGKSLTAIMQDRAGDLWVGTESHGLLRFGSRGTTRYGPAEGLRSMVRVVFQDRAGCIWVGARDGVYRLGPTGFELFASTSGLVNAVDEGPGESLWVGTTVGLVRTEGRGLVPVPLPGWSGAIDVTAVRFEPDGTLWIGTAGGGLWQMRDGRGRGFTRREGLHEDSVFAILDDGLGSLWLSGNHGITRVRREELEAVAGGQRNAVATAVLGKADGMKEPECSGGIQPAAFRAPDGRLWFATIRGAVVVDPARITVNQPPPPVIVEDVVADGRRLSPVGVLRLPPGTRHLEIRYTGIGLAGADRIRFRHRLDGLDKDFVDAGAERVAHYAGLAPGRYRFHVTAANENGVWNESGAALAFEIEPRVWQSTWFRLLAVAAVAGLAFAGFHLRVRSMRSQQRALAARVDEEMAKVKVLTGLLPICA